MGMRSLGGGEEGLTKFICGCSVGTGVRLIQGLCPDAGRFTLVASGDCNNVSLRTLMGGRVNGVGKVSFVPLSKHGGSVCGVVRRVGRLPPRDVVLLKA